MMMVATFEPTRCAICNLVGEAIEIYPANFDIDAFNVQTFSARRTPDRIHYRIVRCNHCGLLRSDPTADTATINALYQRSKMDYTNEVDSLRATYGYYLSRLGVYQREKGCLLEIGCANGFFLEEALTRGYECVKGVEPGTQMVASASSAVREHIVINVMRPDLFEPSTFDVVCLFQVFDHLPDPAGVLREAYRVLRPNGLILLFNHNEQAVSARLLGERSPIIDIEHTYLYNLTTMGHILENNGYDILELAPSRNEYRVNYLIRLLPLPSKVRSLLSGLAKRTKLYNVQLEVSLGNLYAIGKKKADDEPRA